MNLEKSLWLDISEKCTGWSVFDNGVLINFGSFVANGSNFGEQLSTFHEHVVSLLNIFSPAVIGIEDIYAQNVKTYKSLAGLQAVAVYSSYRYNKCVPLLVNASSIRKYEKLNIETILTRDLWIKKHSKKYKTPEDLNSAYNLYLGNPKHYIHRFKHIDFSKCNDIRLYDEVYYDITNAEHLKVLTTVLKNGKVKILGAKLKEFDYAKKIIVVDKVNTLFPDVIKKFNYGKLLTYCENDVADSVYSNYVMLNFILEA